MKTEVSRKVVLTGEELRSLIVYALDVPKDAVIHFEVEGTRGQLPDKVIVEYHNIEAKEWSSPGKQKPSPGKQKPVALSRGIYLQSEEVNNEAKSISETIREDDRF